MYSGARDARQYLGRSHRPASVCVGCSGAWDASVVGDAAVFAGTLHSVDGLVIKYYIKEWVGHVEPAEV